LLGEFPAIEKGSMLTLLPTFGGSFDASSSKPALVLKADAPALDAHARAVTSARVDAELLPVLAAAPASAVEQFLRPREEPLEDVKQWARLAGALANNRRLKFVAATSLKSPAAPTPGLIRNWLLCGQASSRDKKQSFPAPRHPRALTLATLAPPLHSRACTSRPRR
jgi:hypothetical protein